MKPAVPETIGQLLAAPELSTLADALRADRIAVAYGLWGSSGAAVATAVQNKLDRPILFVCGHVDEADDIADDIELFSELRHGQVSF